MFLAHLQAPGFPQGSDDAFVTAGYGICHAVEMGNSVDAVKAVAETELGQKGYPVAKADQLVTYSIADLCPHAGR